MSSVYSVALEDRGRVLASARSKRIVIVSLLMAALTLYFWLGSRYPALNQKASMGTETPISGLAFSTIVKASPDAGLATRIGYATINWMYTNRQGMTFGILFGALVLTLLALVPRWSFRSRFANSLMGMVIGAPLGVCANCAAPIGKGIHAAGGRAETMLAAMVASPTLNVVVITMVIAMFPPFMATIKIALTLGFILIGIPLVTRLLGTPNTVPISERSLAPSLAGIPARIQDQSMRGGAVDLSSGESWLQAVRAVVGSFAGNLWYIVKTTVPLMILAGFLGSVAVTLLPLESLTDVVPTTGRRMKLLGMGAVALIGMFMPVPMTFDVIATAVLWQAGLPIAYTMVLLFTLGIFSIYSFFIIWQSIGRAMAAVLFLGLAGLGVVSGYAAQRYFAWDYARQQKVFFDIFGRSSASLHGPTVLRVGGDTRGGTPDRDLVPSLQQAALSSSIMAETKRDGVWVERIALEAPAGRGGSAGGSSKLFTRLEGPALGIDEPFSFSVLRFEGPFTQFRGVASGDVHNDGWVDLLMSSDVGLSLYANNRGKGFVRQAIDIPALKEFYVTTVALVDLNNDGWLDIVFATYRSGNYVIYNDHGRFPSANLQKLPRPAADAMVTPAMAFGDLGRHGQLDIVMGDWAHPCQRWDICDDRPSNNFVLRNEGGRFRVEEALKGLPGRQTLNLLLSDINNDGKLDLIIGSEDYATDYYFLGNGDGTFRQITRGQNIIPRTGGSTMSVSSADIDNDLRPEIYVGQITQFSGKQKNKSRDADPKICDEITTPAYRKSCQEMMQVHAAMPLQTRPRDVSTCLAAGMEAFREDCVAYAMLLWARTNGPRELCDMLPDRWDAFKFNCHYGYKERISTSSRPSRPPEAIPVTLEHNVLLSPTGDGRFVDKAAAMGVETAGFTWNAKFADLDNDGFVDLYAVNGWFPGTWRESHVFYKNQGGKRFVDATEDAGLGSFLPTSAYTYIDVHNTGYLDIVAVPTVGPVLVYENNSRGNRIVVELRDEIGNRFGIGSKVILHYGSGSGAQHQMREIQASGGFLSFDAPIAYFGLGNAQRVERIEIHWSTGERNEITGDFSAGSRYIVHRGAPGKIAQSR